MVKHPVLGLRIETEEPIHQRVKILPLKNEATVENSMEFPQKTKNGTAL